MWKIIWYTFVGFSYILQVLIFGLTDVEFYASMGKFFVWFTLGYFLGNIITLFFDFYEKRRKV